jgi:hypothetical protein
MASKKVMLNKLIIEANTFGFPEKDIRYAKEYLKLHEYGLCLDQILQQLYEFGIKVDYKFYHLAKEVSLTLNLPNESIVYIKELID